MNKTKFACKILIVLAGGLMFAECFLRMTSRELPLYVFQNKILAEVWMRKKTSLAMPPFNLITNREWAEKSRLDQVYVYSMLPPGTDYEASDFLRLKNIPYRIHINSLGYRGREIPPVKEKGVYRVASYGSYMTFGHGVNDNQTYSAVAESILNAERSNRRFEVLNGGMETGSFIMGLSRLSHETEKLQPDTVVFEYGFIDGLALPRDTVAEGFFKLRGLPEVSDYPLLRKIPLRTRLVDQYFYQPLMLSPLGWSYVLNAYLRNDGIPDPVPEIQFALFKKALIATCLDLRARHIKVILLENPVLTGAPVGFFREIAAETGAIYVDGKKVFTETPLTNEEVQSFEHDSFLAEAGVDCKRDECSEIHKKFAPYMQDLFQLSPRGQAIIGAAVASAIRQAAGITKGNSTEVQ